MKHQSTKQCFTILEKWIASGYQVCLEVFISFTVRRNEQKTSKVRVLWRFHFGRAINPPGSDRNACLFVCFSFKLKGGGLLVGEICQDFVCEKLQISFFSALEELSVPSNGGFQIN